MAENWIKWYPTEIPRGKYELTEIKYNWDGVIVEINDERHIVELFFDGILSLRLCDEGDRWKTIDLILSQNDKNYFDGHPLFTASDSMFREWFDSENFYTHKAYQHFVIVTQNDIVDVLAIEDPKVGIKQVI